MPARRPERDGEFPEGAAEAPDGLTRRSFLQVLGASAALAGLEACKPPREKLVAVRPPGRGRDAERPERLRDRGERRAATASASS